MNDFADRYEIVRVASVVGIRVRCERSGVGVSLVRREGEAGEGAGRAAGEVYAGRLRGAKVKGDALVECPMPLGGCFHGTGQFVRNELDFQPCAVCYVPQITNRLLEEFFFEAYGWSPRVGTWRAVLSE